MVTYYHHETKFYRSESTFLNAIRGLSENSIASVKVFEEIESNDSAYEYKKNLITQRERDEQLSIILSENKELQILYQIKNIIQEHIRDTCVESQRTLPVSGRVVKRNIGNDIIERFNSRGVTLKNFKGIFSNNVYKNYLIYTGPSTKEWYKLILQIHKFKISDTYSSSKFTKNILKVDKERIENYNLAKKELSEGI
jgi:hypothetical protein